MTHILIVDDDQSICETLELYLTQQKFQVTSAHSVAGGIKKLKTQPFNILILDVKLPDANGITFLSELKKTYRDLPVIMITAFHDMHPTIKAMQIGAFDFIHKPIDLDELDLSIQRILHRVGHEEEDDQIISRSADHISNILVGKSRAIKEVYKAIGLLSQSNTTALILGESGTGKELVARAIHNNSDQPQKPFIHVNCSALVETLLESELFGHEKGAFTGADFTRVGKFEQAKGGTLFLDEIGEISLSLQVKLARFLQDREFERVGGSKRIQANFRIIAATNQNLLELIGKGKFREDLYYRLNVMTIHIPALRERKEDIPLLTEHLLQKINAEMNKCITRIPKRLVEAFRTYDWHGNVRELENTLRRMAVLSNGKTLSEDNFTLGLPAQEGDDESDHGLKKINPEIRPLEESLAEIEKKAIAQALIMSRWNKGKVCKLLGISRPRLERKINKYQIIREPPTTKKHNETINKFNETLH